MSLDPSVPSPASRRPSRRPTLKTSEQLQEAVTASATVPAASKPAFIRAIQMFDCDELHPALVALYWSLADLTTDFGQAYTAFVKASPPKVIRERFCTWITAHASDELRPILLELDNDLIMSGKVFAYMGEIEAGTLNVDEIAKRYKGSGWLMSCERLRAAVDDRERRMAPPPVPLKGAHSYRGSSRTTSGQANL